MICLTEMVPFTKAIATKDTSLRKEGGGPSYINFIQTECHKRDKKLLL